MPITTTHPEYDANFKVWRKCRDFVAGEDAVKAAGELYLPKITNQTALRYESFKQRAYFYGAVGRTSAALTGGMLRKLPLVKLPQELKYLEDDATGTGLSIYELIARITKEQLDVARCGILVDIPTNGGNPYLALSSSEEITNWGEDFFVIRKILDEPDPDDRFTHKSVNSYRELTLNDEGNYIVIEHRQEDATNNFEETEFQPTSYGRPLNYIPFTIISPTGLDNEVDKPPVKDLVDILAHHYLVSADLAWANHLLSIPTPVVIGDIEEGISIELGGSTALRLPTGSQFLWTEFTGAGLSSLHETLAKLEAQMAALGARLLDTRNKTIIESAAGALTKEAAATSVMSQVLLSIEAGLERSLRWAAEWVGANPDKVEVKLNRDLLQTNIDANMLNSMLQSVQAGLMSFETFYYNLENAGLSQPGVEPSEEVVRIIKTLDMMGLLQGKEGTPQQDLQTTEQELQNG